MASPVARTSRKRKPKSCAQLRREARRKRTKKQREAALKRLPARCKPRKKTPPPQVQVTLPQGTQPQTPMVSPPVAGTPDPVPPPPQPPAPAPAPAPAPSPTATPTPTPAPSRLTTIVSPIAVYAGTFGPQQAERLLWRAGFGPRPGQVQEFAALDLENAVLRLTRPTGVAPMTGAEPTVGGQPLDPYNTWAHDHLWWMDRMLRSEHQLVERLALVFHDWFATSDDAVGSSKFMIDQSNIFRAHGLGSFADMVHAITQDPAMMLFLSQIENRKFEINENYARELMELFTLGADRGAYTETDVRELARSLSGWRADWVNGVGWTDFRWDEYNRWDPGEKTVFGRRARHTWVDACRLVLEHPMHASFFVTKLWSYFIPVKPDAETQAKLETLYLEGGKQIRPVLEAILCSPQFYEGPAMVKPPVVFVVGMMRARNRAITSAIWEWVCSNAGQRLFYPPDVAGWDDTRWMSTSTTRGRWEATQAAVEGGTITSATWNTYPSETAEEAVARALAFWGDPAVPAATRSALVAWAQNAIPATASAALRAQRQNALRQLVAASPDYQVC